MVSPKFSSIHSGWRRSSKTFHSSWTSYHAIIEGNIFSVGFFQMSHLCSQKRSKTYSTALLTESQKQAFYHGQGHGQGPPLHLVASKEEWSHRNHSAFHTIKNYFLLIKTVCLTHDNLGLISFIEIWNTPYNALWQLLKMRIAITQL